MADEFNAVRNDLDRIDLQPASSADDMIDLFRGIYRATMRKNGITEGAQLLVEDDLECFKGIYSVFRFVLQFFSENEQKLADFGAGKAEMYRKLELDINAVQSKLQEQVSDIERLQSERKDLESKQTDLEQQKQQAEELANINNELQQEIERIQAWLTAWEEKSPELKEESEDLQAQAQILLNAWNGENNQVLAREALQELQQIQPDWFEEQNEQVRKQLEEFQVKYRLLIEANQKLTEKRKNS